MRLSLIAHRFFYDARALIQLNIQSLEIRVFDTLAQLNLNHSNLQKQDQQIPLQKYQVKYLNDSPLQHQASHTRLVFLTVKLVFLCDPLKMEQPFLFLKIHSADEERII